MRHCTLALFLFGAVVFSSATADSPGSQERSWTPAKQTDVAVEYENQLIQGTSPRPTDEPVPVFGRMYMVKRLDGYTLGPLTCGFVSSNGYSLACVSSTDTCAYEDGYVGCCQPNQACSKIKRKCLNYRQSRAGSCTSATDTHTVCCNSKSPECYTYVMTFSGGAGSTTGTYTALACSPAPGSGVLLDYDPSWSETHIFPSPTGTSPTPTTTTGVGGGGESKSNVGAIAGGTVGGVAALALVGLGVFLLLRRKRSDKNSRNTQSTPPVAPMEQNSQGPFPPPNHPQGYHSQVAYDPHMSTFNHQQPGQHQYGQYPQQQQQPGYQYNNTAGFAVSTASPSSHVAPSPHAGCDAIATNKAHTSPSSDAAQARLQQPSELGSVHPVGHQANRAELGGS